MTLLLISCSFLLGVYLATQFTVPPYALIPFGLLAPLAVWQRKRPCLTLFLGSLLLLALGLLRVSLYRPSLGDISQYNDDLSVALTGMVTNDPEVRGKNLQVHLAVERIFSEDQPSVPVTGTVLVYAPPFSDIRYGDRLQVTGSLQTPPQFPDYDYRSHLARQGIGSVMFQPQLSLLERGSGSQMWGWLYSWRNKLASTLATVLPEPQASLAQGILLGRRGTLPKELQEAFSRTGTTHIIAISGQNITIVAGMLTPLAIWSLGRRRAFPMVLGAIWLYAALAGLGPSVVRAAIMGSLFVWATYLGRQASVIPALAFSATLMVALHYPILWDVSFQLSFLAMAGVVSIGEPLAKQTRRWIVHRFFRGIEEQVPLPLRALTDAFCAGVGATVLTSPIIAFNFGRFPLVGPLATLLALPSLPFIIPTSAAAAVGGLFSPWLATPLGWVSWLPLTYLIEVVNLWALFPGASATTPDLSQTAVQGFYVLVAVAFIGSSQRHRLTGLGQRAISALGRAGQALSAFGWPPQRGKRWVVLGLGGTALLLWSAVFTLPDDRLHLTVLDVGQGDAILMQFRGRYILVDGGPDPQRAVQHLGQRLPFWERTVDLVVLTHPQSDHMTGLFEVLKRYRVPFLLEGCPPPQDDTNSIARDRWETLIEEKAIDQRWAQAKSKILVGKDITIRVLNPTECSNLNKDDMNNRSVVLQVVMNRASFLLTGDIEAKIEARLVAADDSLSSSVLKVAHHGSRTSTSQRFLEAVQPIAAVISTGKDNRYGHPHPEVLERLNNVLLFRTDRHGTVEFLTDGVRLWIKTDRK